MNQFLVGLIIIEMVSCSGDHHRQKRWFWYNGDAKTILGLILTVPLSIFLPGLGPQGRLIDRINSRGEECNEFIVQPQYEEELYKIHAVFRYLGVTAFTCQETLICHMSSMPTKYSPVSDLILREMRKENGPVYKSEKSLMWRYLRAAKVGLISTEEECSKAFAGCRIRTRNLLNGPILKLWQFFADKVNMKLV